MLYLVTGGSGSGKSEYAEKLAVHLRERLGSEAGRLYYVATMYSYDRECDKRIARHRLMRRDKGFSTIEMLLRHLPCSGGQRRCAAAGMYVESACQ